MILNFWQWKQTSQTKDGNVIVKMLDFFYEIGKSSCAESMELFDLFKHLKEIICEIV